MERINGLQENESSQIIKRFNSLSPKERDLIVEYLKGEPQSAMPEKEFTLCPGGINQYELRR